jgi:uncharacterized protein
LFESVALHDDDGQPDADAREVLRRRHLPVITTAQGDKVELPCPALDGVLCSVYQQRPKRCAAFACALLHKVEDRRLTVAQARRRIDEVRTLVDGVRARHPAPLRWWSVRRRLAVRAAELDAGRRQLLVDLDRLHRLVRAHFWQAP